MQVQLQQLVGALETTDDFTSYVFDRETGQILCHTEGIEDEEWQEMLDCEMDGVPNRYLCLPDQFDIHQYRIMEDFVAQLSPGRTQDEFIQSLHGKGAFRRFRETLRYHGMQQRWYAFLADAYRQIAISWCEENGLQYTE